MPSPFPGMDPYLERIYWADLHHSLIVYVAEQIQPMLVPKYVATLHEREEIETPSPHIKYYEKRLIPLRLQRCRIPLREEDDDVVLDLPAVFNRCYEVGAYAALIDYAQPPPVNISERETEWLTAHLQNQHRNGSTA